ncbi:hypothetical protein ERX27_05555 [Macrococcus brunensis]|uniref:SD-repeat containing protein B domain-containing protein n=1 Tax=Macrococcus brunensis TaxID=198483 RepID=A0A4V3BDM2_9STAP|nr:hypothetical protein [Macrococcus brunensis]TDL97926.1 hypothetical protein ERX27_05555 [Macrococcus brunensis]
MKNNKNKFQHLAAGTSSLLIVSAMLLNQAAGVKAAPNENRTTSTNLSLFDPLSTNAEIAMKAIQGNVMLDDNKDGLGDYNLRYSEVLLLDRKGNVIRSTWTDDTGFYQFINIPTGDYTLRFPIAIINDEPDRPIRYQIVDVPIYIKSYDINIYNLVLTEPDSLPPVEVPTTEAPTTEALTTEAPTTEAPTSEVPTTEAPTTETPTSEVPMTEVLTTETPTTEEPTSEVPTSEVPTTETPTTEEPTTETPMTEAPTTESPTTEDPMTEAPTTEAPTTETPTTEVPTTEVSTTELPMTEAPITETPTTEEPTTEEPITETPTTEAPTTEAPTTEAPTMETPTTEAPTTEAPTTEAPTTEAPTTETPTTETPTTEESITELPTTETPTTEEHSNHNSVPKSEDPDIDSNRNNVVEDPLEVSPPFIDRSISDSAEILFPSSDINTYDGSVDIIPDINSSSNSYSVVYNNGDRNDKVQSVQIKEVAKGKVSREEPASSVEQNKRLEEKKSDDKKESNQQTGTDSKNDLKEMPVIPVAVLADDVGGKELRGLPTFISGFGGSLLI